MVRGLLIELAWVVFFIFLSPLAFQPRRPPLFGVWRLTMNDQFPRIASRLSYLRVFLTFARNSLVRNMTFRANFIIECISSCRGWR